MKTEYDADAAFLHPNTGRTGTPLFYALMLRSRGKISDTTEYQIGKYGRMRKRFLEENHRGIYSHMILSETLWKHLAEIDEECNEMMDRLVSQMAKKEGVTEQLKSNDWLCWLQKMNSIRSRAEEVVLHDLIYSIYFYSGFKFCSMRRR